MISRTTAAFSSVPPSFFCSFSNCLNSFSTRLWSSRRVVIASMSSSRSAAQPRQQLAFEEGQEAVLVGADLVEVEVVEAGVRVRLERLQVRLRVRAERRVGSRLLLGQRLARGLEVRRQRQLLRELAAEPRVGP